MQEAITVVFYLVVMMYSVWHDHVDLISGAHKDLTPDGQNRNLATHWYTQTLGNDHLNCCSDVINVCVIKL